VTPTFPGTLAGILLALFLSSCASHNEISRDGARVFSPETLTTMLRERDGKIASMTGRGTLAFDNGTSAGSAFFTLALHKPDSLLLSFEGPFGIGSGFLFLCRQKFVMYNSGDNRVVTGVPTARALRGVIPIDLTADQIIDAFTGSFRPPDGEPVSSLPQDGAILLEYEQEGNRHKYLVDTGDGVVTRYEVCDDAGNPLLRVESSRMREEAGVSLPRHILIVDEAAGRRLDVYYSSFDVNPGDLSFSYEIPANARTTIR